MSDLCRWYAFRESLDEDKAEIRDCFFSGQSSFLSEMQAEFEYSGFPLELPFCKSDSRYVGRPEEEKTSDFVKCVQYRPDQAEKLADFLKKEGYGAWKCFRKAVDGADLAGASW